MSTTKKETTGKENKSTTTKNKGTSGGGKDVNNGGKPARELKRGKGETSGSRGTNA